MNHRCRPTPQLIWDEATSWDRLWAASTSEPNTTEETWRRSANECKLERNGGERIIQSGFTSSQPRWTVEWEATRGRRRRRRRGWSMWCLSPCAGVGWAGTQISWGQAKINCLLWWKSKIKSSRPLIPMASLHECPYSVGTSRDCVH